MLSLTAQPVIELESYATGFDEPVDIANAGDGRLFIVERDGRIKIIDEDGTVLPSDFLDIHTLVESGYSEQGLLGLAFHPDYDSTGYFFVYYIDNDENTVVARYSVNTLDPNDADEDSELIIYTADQPYLNHNGGCIKFGPDGYLYIGLGDGGSAGDPGNRAQDAENKLGKIHRMDINGVEPYSVPESNPYYGSADTLETIWDIGLRNPWRYSFDRLTGDLWIADVGQNLWEEVNFEAAGTGGANYGWRCYEGNHSFSLGGCEDEDFYTFPIIEYGHSFSTGGYAVTGGYVYRGDDYPGMHGYYIFADYVSGNWWYTYQEGPDAFTTTFLDDIEDDISAFGEDVNGELYCADMSSGIIYHITDACGAFDISTLATDYYCDEVTGTASVSITAGVEPISIEWSTGETETTISGLAVGEYSITVTDGIGCVREQTIVINNLEPEPAEITYSGYDIMVSVGMAWQWYYEGNPIEGATASTLTLDPSNPGTYSVAITYDNGCTIFSLDFEFIIDNLENSLLEKMSLYPNPASDILNISGPEQIEITAFRLYSMQGNLVYAQNGDFNRSIHSIDVSALSSGLYYAVLFSSAGTGAYQVEILH